MNEIVNKFSLSGDEFLPIMNLRQPGFTYSICVLFIKTKEGYRVKKTGDSRCTDQNELGKACFQHDMAYEDFKSLTRRTASHEILHDKASNSAKNLTHDGTQRCPALMVCNFFDNKKSGGVIKNGITSNIEEGKPLASNFCN